MRPLQCNEEISNGKKKSFSLQPDFIAWFLQNIFRHSCIVTSSVGHWRWWFRFPAYSSRGSTSSLNCHLLSFPIYFWFFLIMNISFFLVKVKCMETLSPFLCCFYRKFSLDVRRFNWSYRSRNHLRDKFGEWLYL